MKRILSCLLTITSVHFGVMFSLAEESAEVERVREQIELAERSYKRCTKEVLERYKREQDLGVDLGSDHFIEKGDAKCHREFIKEVSPLYKKLQELKPAANKSTTSIDSQ